MKTYTIITGLGLFNTPERTANHIGRICDFDRNNIENKIDLLISWRSAGGTRKAYMTGILNSSFKPHEFFEDPYLSQLLELDKVRTLQHRERDDAPWYEIVDWNLPSFYEETRDFINQAKQNISHNYSQRKHLLALLEYEREPQRLLEQAAKPIKDLMELYLNQSKPNMWSSSIQNLRKEYPIFEEQFQNRTEDSSDFEFVCDKSNLNIRLDSNYRYLSIGQNDVFEINFTTPKSILNSDHDFKSYGADMRPISWMQGALKRFEIVNRIAKATVDKVKKFNSETLTAYDFGCKYNHRSLNNYTSVSLTHNKQNTSLFVEIEYNEIGCRLLIRYQPKQYNPGREITSLWFCETNKLWVRSNDADFSLMQNDAVIDFLSDQIIKVATQA